MDFDPKLRIRIPGLLDPCCRWHQRLIADPEGWASIATGGWHGSSADLGNFPQLESRDGLPSASTKPNVRPLRLGNHASFSESTT
ncbi:hypothetical protein ACJ73_01293 [Blastomyces percursus]|uniref:Uncharacterized protein n=1 Tax=Blastomyces percursus TaxID=1658174 RepID=A0A1J9QFP0_9EURO|nr:hypothetical protein ACJ73_01293 [Blastomyces percursus]